MNKKNSGIVLHSIQGVSIKNYRIQITYSSGIQVLKEVHNLSTPHRIL